MMKMMKIVVCIRSQNCYRKNVFSLNALPLFCALFVKYISWWYGNQKPFYRASGNQYLSLLPRKVNICTTCRVNHYMESCTLSMINKRMMYGFVLVFFAIVKYIIISARKSLKIKYMQLIDFKEDRGTE